MKKQRIKFLFVQLGLLAVVISAPVAVAAMLIQAASSAAGQENVARLSMAPPDSATDAANAIVAGVLYTNGPVKVDWNGINIPVQNSSYAYTGGELITTPPNGMGILRLSGGGTVFVCPGSKVRLSRTPAGNLTVDVTEGKSRFMFPAGTPFEVRVNDTVLSPESAVPPPEDGAQPQMFAGEVESTKDGGCLLCGLQNNLKVSGPGAASGGGALSVLAGQIITVPSTHTAGAAAGTATPSILDMPGNAQFTVKAGLDAAGGGGGFLCKCRELEDYAVRLAELMARQEAGDIAESKRIEAEIAQGGTGDLDLPLPDARPPVAPPSLPGLVAADTGAPDPFVPRLNPAAGEPGAGEPSALSDTTIIVPPPLVPGSGTGGGAVVSPS